MISSAGGDAMQKQSATDASTSQNGHSATLTTRGAVTMTVRAVKPSDEPVLQALFDHVAPADLRFRFLSSMRHVDHARLDDMLHVDHQRRETFLAFDGDMAIATAMLAAEPGQDDAEVAISVRSDMKGRGVGWTLLQYVMGWARARGFTAIHSVENGANRTTIDLERDAGFDIRPCEGDPGDVVATKSLKESDH